MPASSTPKKRKTRTRRVQELAAIEALVRTGSAAEAAVHLGCHERTVRRWLQRPGVRTRIETARNAAMEGIVVAVVNSASLGLAALVRNATCGHPSVEVKAGAALLSNALSFESHRAAVEEIAFLKDRIAAIEAAHGGGRS